MSYDSTCQTFAEVELIEKIGILKAIQEKIYGSFLLLFQSVQRANYITGRNINIYLDTKK